MPDQVMLDKVAVPSFALTVIVIALAVTVPVGALNVTSALVPLILLTTALTVADGLN
jgi:hypothetical protein